jgi:L,D-peptidoglycan transpeptidase YkuD (ErfK/YbiS/YcfS/YnhG family)
MNKRLRRRRRRLFLVFTLLLLLLGTGAIIVLSSAAKPPLESIKTGRESLAKARMAEAEHYAKDLLLQADDYWQQAMIEWKIQNEKWFVSRNYAKLNELSKLTIDKADAAYEKSILVKDSLHRDLAASLHIVDEKLNSYEKNYMDLPLNKQARTDYSTAKMLFLESREAYERGDYNSVGPKLEKSKELIIKSVARAHGLLEGYFGNFQKWKRWANETIEWSRQNSATAIVVDKFAQKCYVYRNGVVKTTFDAEFGPNWIGVKQHKGDKATPEGKYHITKKKNHRDTKYYKALLINYPNDDDKARYSAGIKNGTISKRTSIGNLIEIHGDGGRGANWTDGCIALTNADMDKLYELAGVGTPVTIVGSLKSLQDVNGF